jgi:hypothetical protein
MPYQRVAQALLEQWRENELRLKDMPLGSPEADELKLKSYGLRNEY